MTNREKYRFDDFTFENYKRLIKQAKSKGFKFILHRDKFEENRKDVIWRHDVEFEPDIALKMAKIENEEDVVATYFFQLHSDYYNLFDCHYRDIFFQIKNLGHHVGLHFDCAYWQINDEKQLDKYIGIDKDYLTKNLGVEIDTFSFHNTTPFTQNCLEFRYGELINVYSSFFKEHYNYCSDSLGYWRFDKLEDVLNDDNVLHLQVLTHDANWSDTVMSPRDRIGMMIRNHAERVFSWHVDFLHQHGHLSIGDNEV